MTARSLRAKREAVDGVLLLDKPPGITSQSAVSRVKHLYNAEKAGHTGTLDPAATGLLPIALGEATKFSSALLDADKTYVATVRLGITTATGDLEGEVTAQSTVETDVDRIEAALAQFRGEITQVPPMYSALKHQGKPLYTYARQGKEIERLPRAVTISELTLEDYIAPDLVLTVACSKGTYIRVLAEDLGRALGCGAALAALRRTRVGRFDVADATGLEALAAASAPERLQKLLAVDAMIAELPALSLDAHQSSRVASGQGVECVESLAVGVVRLLGPGGEFLGIAESTGSGRLQPRRLVASKATKG